MAVLHCRPCDVCLLDAGGPGVGRWQGKLTYSVVVGSTSPCCLSIVT